MKKAHFEFEEIPFSTLARFGLTQEMIEDLPMHVLDDIYNGRHSPVLPVRVTDEHGETVESRTRFALIRMEGGQTDVVFHPESLLAVPVGAEQVVYPGGQHFQFERFGQITVRSGFITIYSVVRALFGCQHDDGDMAGFEL